ncbi:hypothetical protein Patl1_00119 [Pistacia atlantica]|uniref:Uncharacterized protein n=1 Tax=Pistacia atlantica TaxID=434234 RepID=A0ACC1C6W5_9ROSI|nr:hypothetical protein Patl1_00119 [Pistacia atlantica]
MHVYPELSMQLFMWNYGAPYQRYQKLYLEVVQLGGLKVIFSSLFVTNPFILKLAVRVQTGELIPEHVGVFLLSKRLLAQSNCQSPWFSDIRCLGS